MAFGSNGTLRRFRWVIAASVIFLLFGALTMARSATQRTPASTLATIAHLEKISERDAFAEQELSVFLSTVGRLDESEAASGWQFEDGEGEVIPLDDLVEDQRLDLSQFEPLPWQSEMEKVAGREQLIVIMEAHNAPGHRRWIEQVLPILHRAGFRDYAAEGLYESGVTLMRRGYPVSTTGAYVNDPCFGNLLRRAMKLNFRLHEYEPTYESPEQREHDQAANLARLFEADPNLKLVVHCGYAHAEKRSGESGEQGETIGRLKMMAARLWEMTGIEPYCILQSWHGPYESDSRQLAELTGVDREPYMLSPMPENLADIQFRVPKGSFDALVVHPAARNDEHVFPSNMRTNQTVLRGTWPGPEWPVLIGAFRNGENADAIALDQVMLREGESDFALTVPDENSTVRVFGLRGKLNRQPNLEKGSAN